MIKSIKVFWLLVLFPLAFAYGQGSATIPLNFPDSVLIVLENTRNVDASVIGSGFASAWATLGIDQQQTNACYGGGWHSNYADHRGRRDQQQRPKNCETRGVTKECPSCAMDIDEDSKECPICGYEFPSYSRSFKLVALLLAIRSC